MSNTLATPEIIAKRILEHVSFDWGVIQRTTSIEDIDERYMKPASIALANALEVEIAKCYRDFYNFVGTAGTTPSSYETITQARAKLSHEGVPNDGRTICVLNPDAYGKYAYAMSSLYSGDKAVTTALRDYNVGTLGGMKTYESQNIQAHDCGFQASDTILVNGAGQTGSTLNIDGCSNTTGLKYGDKFTLGATTTSIYAVNSLSGDSTGSLRCFTVTADATVSSGAVAASISPSIITSGAYKTVSAAAANNCVVNETTTDYVANLIFHPYAIALASIPIQLPDSCSFKAKASYEGLSLTITKDFDIDGYSEAVRIDMLAAIKCIQPEFGCIVMG